MLKNGIRIIQENHSLLYDILNKTHDCFTGVIFCSFCEIRFTLLTGGGPNPKRLQLF